MDAELIQEIVSSGSLVLSAVTLLVSRLDRRKDDLTAKNSVLALTKLESLLDGWIQKSRVTNTAVRGYLEGRNNLRDMRYAIGDQYAIFEGHIADDKPMVEQWRTGRWRKKQNLTQFLRIYIPEFAEAFETTARKRFALLARAEFATEPTHELVKRSKCQLKRSAGSFDSTASVHA